MLPETERSTNKMLAALREHTSLPVAAVRWIEDNSTVAEANAVALCAELLLATGHHEASSVICDLLTKIREQLSDRLTEAEAKYSSEGEPS